MTMVNEINSSGKIKDKLLRIKRKKLKKSKQEQLVKRLEKEQFLGKDNAKEETLQESKEQVHPITISIAIPGSIFDNAQSLQLKTYLVGQIARAAAIYKVLEIIIFNESPSLDQNGSVEDEKLYGKGCMEMAHLLQYLECPQYLRKSLFPHHPDLQYVGLLNPLDSPHHLRVDEWCNYREAVVVNKPAPVKSSKASSYVNAGLYRDVKIDRSIQPGTRVTIKFDQRFCAEFTQAPDTPTTPANSSNAFAKKKLKARVVPPQEPYITCNLYWGYNVRLAQDFSSVFTKCPYKNENGNPGYDLKIGTSDKGENIYQNILDKDFLYPINEKPLSNYKHCLIVFGGLRGLEYSFEMDDPLFNRYNHVSQLFDYYVNVCPHQGSRTIRTEEALLIALSLITPVITQINDMKSRIDLGNVDNNNVTLRE